MSRGWFQETHPCTGSAVHTCPDDDSNGPILALAQLFTQHKALEKLYVCGFFDDAMKLRPLVEASQDNLQKTLGLSHREYEEIKK